MNGYIGIDYGNGLTNIDNDTGIRYGVVRINNLSTWVWDELEPQYHPSCPYCGSDIADDDYDSMGFICPHCEHDVTESDLWEDSPDCYSYDGDDWKGFTTHDNCYLFVTWSKTVTECQYCSPCYPGAGNIDTPIAGGVKTYGLPDEYFGEN